MRHDRFKGRKLTPLALFADPTLSLLILIMAYVGALGVISKDFGFHWDEPRLISSVQHSAESGSLLPGWYNYPSISYDVSLLAMLPRLIKETVRTWWHGHETSSENLASYAGGSFFHLRLRAAFFLLSVMSALPVYLLARRLTGRPWIALFAGATSISTYEFVYHARWIAPDCLLAMFASFSVFCQYQVLRAECRSRRIAWVVAAAIFAGLCIGTKYPGGLIVVPLLLAIGLSHQRTESLTTSLMTTVIGLLATAAIFAFSTPGCFMARGQFLHDVQWEIAHYSRGHGGYSVVPGWEHFSKLFVYLTTTFLSKNAALATAAAALVVAGAAYLVKTQARVGAWFLSLPVLYCVYMSSQRVMIVRNYQLLLPFFAVLMGWGLLAATAATRARPRLQLLVGTAAALFVVYNLGVATTSSLGIRRPRESSPGSAIEARLSSSPGTRFFLSAASLNAVGAEAPSRHANVVAQAARADEIIFFSKEISDWRVFPANVPGRYRTLWSRSDEVNWDYYPSWLGYDRALEVPAREVAFGPLIANLTRAQQ